jgi:hypothetical protein
MPSTGTKPYLYGSEAHVAVKSALNAIKYECGPASFDAHDIHAGRIPAAWRA